MFSRRVATIAVAAALPLLAPAASATAAPTQAPTASVASHTQRSAATVSITGDVSGRTSYTRSSLAAAFPARQEGRLTGVSLHEVVTAGRPVLPAGKNTHQRVTVTVTGQRGHAVTFALSELDPGAGGNDALLVTSQRGRRTNTVDLTVPGDGNARRSIQDVRRVDVRVRPIDVPAAKDGRLVIKDGKRLTTLSRASLARLPQYTRTTSYNTGKGPQKVTISGPVLTDVLRAARVRTGPTTWVVGVAAGDGYAAAFTPGASTARTPILVGLTQDGAKLDLPRMAPIGDFAGGRYVSGTTGLVVGRG